MGQEAGTGLPIRDPQPAGLGGLRAHANPVTGRVVPEKARGSQLSRTIEMPSVAEAEIHLFHRRSGVARLRLAVVALRDNGLAAAADPALGFAWTAGAAAIPIRAVARASLTSDGRWRMGSPLRSVDASLGPQALQCTPCLSCSVLLRIPMAVIASSRNQPVSPSAMALSSTAPRWFRSW